MPTGTPLTQEEAEREALAVSICERYSLLEEERPVIESIAYSDKYKKILDGICLDKMKLDGMSKEDEEAIIKIKGEALIEKEDPRAFRGSTECKEGNHNVEPLEGRAYEASERCSMPAKTSLDTVKSVNDDEEEYAIQRNKFGASIYGPKPARNEDSDGQWHAKIRLTDPYENVYDQGFVTKKTTRKLAKYHKLSDIMSPNWFQK
ncbi:hypothetical protein Tco_1486847 [Tanacetum coccineum]